MNQYIEENRDRMVELTPEVIAKSQILTEEASPHDSTSEHEVTTNDVYGKAVIDRGMQGRLFQGVKRLLGNPSIKRLMVFDHPFRLVALITPVLVHIRQALLKAVPEPVFDVHFGHPVQFEGHGDFKNDLGLSRLTEASEYAGYQRISFYPEPVAATLSYLHEEGGVPKGVVLTVDYGGGTLDLSVVRFEGLAFDVLSTAGRPIGGDHIDQMIFRELLFPLLGKGEIWSRTRDGRLIENLFPFDEFEDKLLNWAVTYTLNQNHYRSKITDCIKQGGAAAEKFTRLDDLIRHNQSYRVFQAIKKAKADLSEQETTTLDIPELDISVSFSRSQFEAMLATTLVQLTGVTDEVLASAGLSDGDIDVVIRTGGSSLITAVRGQLEGRFPGKVTEHDPFTSVAAGLAIASFHNYQFELLHQA
ncbi:MAG: putative chaperone protein [Candidatus Azotimanducaceae bacterium]